MLQQLIHILLVSCISCIWGMPLFILSGLHHKETPWFRNYAGRLAFLFFCGCITLSLVVSWLYLFFPLRFQYLLVLTAAPILLIAGFHREKVIHILTPTKKNEQPLPPVARLFCLACIFLFLAMAALPPTNRDTHIYHLQIIEWSNHYPAVPGLANLFPRLGLGSAWLQLIALFDIPFLQKENYTYLNASLTIWFFIWLFSTWHFHFSRFRSDKDSGNGFLTLFYFLILAYCLFDWELFRDSANSTNYDLIVTVTTLLALSFLLESIWDPVPDHPFSWLFIIVALSTITFKFSGIFNILPIGYYLYHHPKRYKIPLFILITTLLLTPVLLKNYIITGYPLYPLSCSIAAPDWQLPQGMTDLLHNYITLSNRFYSQEFINTLAFKQAHSIWFLIWFRGILPQHRLIMLLALSSTLIFFTRKPSPLQPPLPARLRPYTMLLLVMTAAWFFTAPSPRFGYGILLPIAALPVCAILSRRIRPAAYIPALWIALASVCLYLPLKAAPLVRDYAMWLRPQPLDRPSCRVIQYGAAVLRLPIIPPGKTEQFCNNTTLPCIYQENPWLQPRGANLREGFRMTHPDSTFIVNYNY